MRLVMIGVLLFAACVSCSPAPVPSTSAIIPPDQRIEHVQAPSKLDVQREMEYRQLKAALEKAQKSLSQFDRMSTWGP